MIPKFVYDPPPCLSRQSRQHGLAQKGTRSAKATSDWIRMPTRQTLVPPSEGISSIQDEPDIDSPPP
ncbi:unnamed protein product [Protopolystoma xenopodis]|uniref:Uncharacterized protein n=1 Tax=Protopolystoma xenopodis TaxID=117903 RepID=A0A3S5FFH8_9PLAT|nr:unnamed protein product [Protopolystoma xenopodis]